jgi:hypothetical protein
MNTPLPATSRLPLPIIQGLWYGSSALGQMERLSIQSFLCHGHEYHLYSYDQITNLPKGALLKDARSIHPSFEMIRNRDGKVLGAAFSDLFRYKLLHDRGHFWADLDVVCIRPFDFADEVVLAAENHRPRAELKVRVDPHAHIGINCNVMKFPAGSAEMAYCYEQALHFDRSRLVFGEIGPELTTRCALKFGLQRFIKPPVTFNPVNYFDFRDLVNPRRKPCFTPATYAIHLWSGAWGNRSWKQKLLNALMRTPAQLKNNRFPPTTLYGELLERYLY